MRNILNFQNLLFKSEIEPWVFMNFILINKCVLWMHHIGPNWRILVKFWSDVCPKWFDGCQICFEVCQASTNHCLMGLVNLFYQTPLDQIGQITKGFICFDIGRFLYRYGVLGKVTLVCRYGGQNKDFCPVPGYSWPIWAKRVFIFNWTCIYYKKTSHFIEAMWFF